MEQVLLVVQVLIAIGLIGMVLLQRSDSDGLGLSGGSGTNFLSGRGTANLLTRTTAVLAALFIANSLALSVLAARGTTPTLEGAIAAAQQAQAPKPGDAADAGAKPATPASPTPSVVKRKQPRPAPAPQAEETPSVPDTE